MMQETKPHILIENQGIDGTSSVTNVPDGKGLWLENVRIGPKTIQKRKGFSKTATLPLKSVVVSDSSLYLESLPVKDCDLWMRWYSEDEALGRSINTLVDKNTQVILDNSKVSVIASINRLPEGFVVTEDTLFRIGTKFYCPLRVLKQGSNSAIVLLPVDSVFAAGFTPAELKAVKDKQSTAVCTLMEGPTFPVFDYRNVSYAQVDPTNDKRVICTLRDIEVFPFNEGDPVFFEAGVWKGTEDLFEPQQATVYAVEEDEVIFEFEEDIPEWQLRPVANSLVDARLIFIEYIRCRIINPRIRVWTNTGTPVYTVEPKGVNTFYSSSFSGFSNAVRYVYGQPNIQGYPAQWINSILKDGVLTPLVGTVPSIFKPTTLSTSWVVSEVSEVPMSTDWVLLKRVSNRITITPESVTPYAIGDQIQTYLEDIYGNIEFHNMDVESITATSLVCTGYSREEFKIYKNQLLHFLRVSNRIPLASSGLVVGDIIQLKGKEHRYEILYVGDDHILVDSSLEFTSYDEVIVDSIMVPLEGTTAMKPLNTATFPSESLQTESCRFGDYVIATNNKLGVHKISDLGFRKFLPPTPPTPFVRSVLGSRGYIPTKKDTNNIPFAPKVSIVVTYAWYDEQGILHESPITPEYDLEITPNVSPEIDEYCEVIEVQVPSIPRDLGYPEGIEIRAYKTAEGTNREMLMVLDQGSVTLNNYDSAYTTILVGAYPDDLQFSGYQLYTVEKDGEEYRPNNAQAPYAAIVTSALGRLWAAGGNSAPYFELSCQECYDKYGNTFTGHFRLKYRDMEFRTTQLYANNDLKGFTVSEGTITPYRNNTSLKQTISSLTYIDYSKRAIVNFAEAPAWVADDVVCMRGLQGALVDRIYPMDFNNTFTVKARSATTLTLECHTGFWDESVGHLMEVTGLGVVYKREKIYPTQDIGASTGKVVVLAQLGEGSTEIEVSIRGVTEEKAFWDGVLNKKIIVYGLKTRGNFRLKGSNQRVSWDTDLVWKVTAVDVNAADDKIFPSGFKATLKPYMGNGEWLTEVEFDTEFSQISSEALNYTVSVFVEDALSAFDGITGLIQKDREVQVTVTGTPDYQEGDLVDFEFLVPLQAELPAVISGTVLRRISPNMFAVECSPSMVAKMGANTQTFTASQATCLRLFNPDGTAPVTGSLFYQDPITLGLRINLTTAVVAGDWVYLLTRGFENSSMCFQLTGYFKVAFTGTGYFTVALGEKIFEDNLLGVYQGGVLYYPSSGGTRYIPIPVAPSVAELDTLRDPVMPLYSSRGIQTPINQIIKRIGHALNSVLGHIGFAYWGGSVGGVLTYPDNGLRFVSHKYPIDRYKEYGDVYAAWSPTDAEYLKPYEQFQLTCEGKYTLSYFDVFSQSMKKGVVENRIIDFSYRVDSRASRIYWTDALASRTGGVAPQFKEPQYEDLNTFEADGITAMVSFQDILLVFKRYSIWRIEFSEEGTFMKNQLPAAVGAVTHQSVVASKSEVYFVHDTGFYVTDGTQVKPVDVLDRYFQEGVKKNILEKCHGFYDALTDQAHIGVPYETDVTVLEEPNGQFVYNCRESVLAWSFDRLRASSWHVYRTDLFYIVDDEVWKRASDGDILPYRDGVSGVPMIVRTKFVDAEVPGKYKIITNMIFHFGKNTERTSGAGMEIGTSWDYGKDYTSLQRIPLTDSGYGVSAWGEGFFGTVELTQTRRSMPYPVRSLSLSVEVSNSQKDVNVPVYGIWFEGILGSSKMVSGGVR